ncbi:MAG: hypothetical protein RR354_06875 [Mucinivorans sp.]
MAFGKAIKLNPQEETIINHTGEYALAAIVNDQLESEDQDEYQRTSDTIYQQMAKCRTTKICYCLPSEICRVAKTYDLNVQLFNPNLPILSDDEAKEEIAKLSVVKSDTLELLAKPEYTYYLLLVNQGRWIAIKRKSDKGLLDLYDPRSGAKEVFSAVGDLATTQALTDHQVDGKTLIIAIK